MARRERPRIDEERWRRPDYQPRYLSDSGRLYFTSPADLVAQAPNHKEDVYEYEPLRVPRAPTSAVSSSDTYARRGRLPRAHLLRHLHRESAFLDASETGGEGRPVKPSLKAAPTCSSSPPNGSRRGHRTDVRLYDAHECTAASACQTPAAPAPPASCETSEVCRPFSYTPATSQSPASTSASGQGNLAQQTVLASKTTKPKPPTRAQLLAKALARCRSTYPHSASKRAACERQAHATYTAKALAECAKSDKHSSKKRKACEKQARKRYGAKARKSSKASTAKGRRSP